MLCSARSGGIPPFCARVLFFASESEATEWTARHAPTAFTLSVEEGWELGRLVNELQYGQEWGHKGMSSHG